VIVVTCDTPIANGNVIQHQILGIDDVTHTKLAMLPPVNTTRPYQTPHNQATPADINLT
jgi:hypothetical protein